MKIKRLATFAAALTIAGLMVFSGMIEPTRAYAVVGAKKGLRSGMQAYQGGSTGANRLMNPAPIGKGLNRSGKKTPIGPGGAKPGLNRIPGRLGGMNRLMNPAPAAGLGSTTKGLPPVKGNGR
jgi:hypothetical protein